MNSPAGKAALLIAALIALVPVSSGCKPDVREKAGDEVKKSPITALIARKEEPPKLPPEAEEIVRREFGGLDLDVSASGAEGVYLGPDGKGADFRDAMVLKHPVFTARTTGGHTTELTGENAVIDPVNKVVVFDKGATVTGPWDNVLECDRLTWHYTRDELEADKGFTLTNGHGITNGGSCRTDIWFRRIRVD